MQTLIPILLISGSKWKSTSANKAAATAPEGQAMQSGARGGPSPFCLSTTNVIEMPHLITALAQN